MDQTKPSAAPLGAVAVGPYVLEVGSPSGTTLRSATQPDRGSEEALARALAWREPTPTEPQPTAGEEVTKLVDEASAATAKVERALAIGKGLAAGKALDPAQLGLEADALLDLLERLDRQGKAKEALRLARAASKLYALLRRWLELLRALRAALGAAEKLGDLSAVGWAKHELGTLQLAGGDVAGAERTLGEAHQIRQRLGDPSDLAATDCNLKVLARRLPRAPRVQAARASAGPRTLRLLPALAVGAVLFCAGVAGGAALGGSSSAGEEAAVTSGTATETETLAGEGATQTVTETAADTVTVTETETVTVEGETGAPVEPSNRPGTVEPPVEPPETVEPTPPTPAPAPAPVEPVEPIVK